MHEAMHARLPGTVSPSLQALTDPSNWIDFSPSLTIQSADSYGTETCVQAQQ